jgi:hypothetical protein
MKRTTTGVKPPCRTDLMNTDEIRQWADYLCRLHGMHGGRTEIRTITMPARIESRLFGDSEPLVDAVERMHEARPDVMAYTNLYTTLNPVDRDFEPARGKSVPDSAITAYLWLPLDIDPIRYDKDEFGVPQMLTDQKLPSTDEELENTRKAAEVIEAMVETATGRRATVSAVSGNGHHRLFRVSGDKQDMQNRVHAILRSLAQIFKVTPLSSHWVNVDTSVANPARIWKLYGTRSKKWTGTGEGKDKVYTPSDTATRPFRMSNIISMREEAPLTASDLEKLQTCLNDYLARYQKETPKPTTTTSSQPTPELRSGTEEWLRELGGVDLMTLDVRSALTEAGHEILNEGIVEYRHNDGTIENKNAVWIKCPNAAQHSSADGEKDAVVYLPKINAEGTRVFAGFDCFHDHCKHLTGAEALHTRIIGTDIVKKHCECCETEAPKPPPATEEGYAPGVNAPEIPQPKRMKREKVRGIDWMLDPTSTPPREVLVEGLLYRGEVLTMSAPTKVGKTYQLMHAAVAWGNGKAWLGMEATRRLRVLYLDPELLEDQAKLRIKTVVVNTLDGRPNSENLDYINLRSDEVMAEEDPWGIVMESLKEWLNSGDQWDLIIVDSMYKFQGNINMNDSGAVVKMLNKLRAVTGAGGQPAIIYVHHYAKGDPGQKKTTDRSAGSFAFSADADSIVTLTPHPESEKTGLPHYNVEFTLRHWAPRDTRVVCRRASAGGVPILDPVDVAPQIDSAFAARRRVGMELCMILDEMIIERASRAIPYDKVVVKVKEWRDVSCTKLGINETAFDASRKIALDEEWLKGAGHAAGKTYRPSESGRFMVEEARMSGNFDHIFGRKTDAPSDSEPTGEPTDEPPWEEPAPATVSVDRSFAGRGLV